MQHFETRARLRQLDRFMPVAKRWATELDPSRDYAVDLGLVDFHGTPWSNESNGSRVVTIIRQGKVVTIMYRRETQPWTPQALSVDKVIHDSQALSRPGTTPGCHAGV